MAVSYRQILTAEAGEANLSNLRTRVLDWLSEKNGREFALTTQGSYENPLSPGHSISYAEVQNGRGRWARWTLRQNWNRTHRDRSGPEASRKAETTITLGVSGDTIWFWLEIDSPMELVESKISGELMSVPQEPGTPNIVKTLLQANEIELYDGVFSLSKGYIPIRSKPAVKDLLTAIEDSSRWGAIYLAMQPVERDFDSWAQLVQRITSYSVGALYLVPADYVEAVNSRMPEGQEISPGSIRTFFPGYKFGNLASHRYSPFLRSERILKSDPSDLARIIRFRQIQSQIRRKLPAELENVDRLFEKARTAIRSQSVLNLNAGTEATNESIALRSETIEEIHVEVDRLISRLAAARELVEAFQEDNQRLEGQLATAQKLTDERDFLIEQLLEEQAAREKAENRVRWMQSRLNSADYLEELSIQHSMRAIPSDFAEVYLRADEFKGLVVLADEDGILELDEHDQLKPGVARLWHILETLNAYSIAKAEGAYKRDLYSYVNDASHGFYMQIRELKAESSTVRASKWMAERRIRNVPFEIEPTGTLEFTKHVDIWNAATLSPRLYYMDRTGQELKKVIIGPIGTHMTNTLTN